MTTAELREQTEAERIEDWRREHPRGVVIRVVYVSERNTYPMMGCKVDPDTEREDASSSFIYQQAPPYPISVPPKCRDHSANRHFDMMARFVLPSPS